ncbi:unnamed protein product [Soboliphyme baturini]|uniref:Uncharacterized protein n=1 Tax=Soboliphyme baturini TaxID=241478 RepID=A0A183IZ86_9BILA|nr:unnamed protein product [Soboliphyme baturini]
MRDIPSLRTITTTITDYIQSFTRPRYPPSSTVQSMLKFTAESEPKTEKPKTEAKSLPQKQPSAQQPEAKEQSSSSFTLSSSLG